MNRDLIQIGSEQPTTIRQAAELVVKISGKPIEIQWDTSKLEGDRGELQTALAREKSWRGSRAWIWRRVYNGRTIESPVVCLFALET